MKLKVIDNPLYKQRTKILKAMAHPSRLAMLEMLAGGERCVCELQALVGSDMSTVSKHLSVMKKAGLVADRKEGLWVHYRLRVPCIMDFMSCVEAVLKKSPAPAQRPAPLRVAAVGGESACCRG